MGKSLCRLDKRPDQLLPEIFQVCVCRLQLMNFLFEGSQERAFIEGVLHTDQQRIIVPGLFDVLLQSHLVDRTNGALFVCIAR